MPSKVVAFPPKLEHSSGATLSIDLSRLVITNRRFVKALFQAEASNKNPFASFKGKPTAEFLKLITPLLDQVGLTLERFPKRARKVNNTPWQIWIRNEVAGKAIDVTRLQKLAILLQSKLNWDVQFAPVYRFPKPPGKKGSLSSGLLSPLPHLVVVKSPPAQKAELLKRLAGYQLVEAPISKYFPEGYFCFVLKNLKGQSAFDLLPHLVKEHPLVEKAWLDYVPAQLPLATYTPTDTLWGKQWNLAPAKLDALAGWNLQASPTQGQNVVVAVVDFGCDLTHPDLVNGFTSTGKTFTYGTPSGDGSYEPGESHGTQCAGIIGARYNKQGLAGLAGQCQILPIRLATFEPSSLIGAIGYAINPPYNARVISLSIEPSSGYDDTALKARIEEAFLTGRVVFCAATGNSNVNQIYHPAAHPRVIACGASNKNDNRVKPSASCSWGSNYNIDPNVSRDPLSGGYLSVMAPGVLIPTTSNQGAGDFTDPDPSENDRPNYTTDFDGTSAATPHVAALAALLFGINQSLTNQQVRNIIERTADKVPSTVNYSQLKPNGCWWDEMGYGRINVRRALQAALTSIPPVPTACPPP